MFLFILILKLLYTISVFSVYTLLYTLHYNVAKKYIEKKRNKKCFFFHSIFKPIVSENWNRIYIAKNLYKKKNNNNTEKL